MGFFLSKLLPQLIYPLGSGLLLQLIAIISPNHTRKGLVLTAP